MNKELPKTYNPADFEDAIYAKWEKSGFFNPDNLDLPKSAKSYTIVLPPPNITAKLHLGHSAMLAIEDLLIRYHRMKGERALWVPGTDHAAIATQNVVEKKLLKEEGKTRHDLGREEFLKKVWEFLKITQSTILHQTRKMGASLDWSRQAFTLDEPRAKAVKRLFVDMYNEDLIYRGVRVVNWCPRCQSTLADDEVEYKEEKGKLYWLKYGPFVLATSRPETKLGDTAVAVYPGDNRYDKMVGKKYMIPGVLGEFEIIVVADRAVDPKFGSGAIKVTPAHDFTDYQIAQRHNLAMKQVINEQGRMMANTGKYAGLTTKEARQAILADMEKMDLLDHIEDGYMHNIAVCYRCGTQIEPLPSKQWFVNVDKKLKRLNGKSLKEKAIEAAESGQIEFIPERFKKRYLDWMNNLHDWCVSRQIWFGHRIPVWYRTRIGADNTRIEITYFVHGTTLDNEAGKSSGHYDVELSELGIKQAKELAGLIKDKKFDVIFTSDLKRATETAKLAFGKSGVKIVKDKRLRECDYGEMERKSEKQVEKMEKAVINKSFPDGESYQDVENRINDFLSDLKKNYAGKKVAIVAHKGPQLALEVLLNGKTWEEALAQDWRKRKAWQPGWHYEVKSDLPSVALAEEGKLKVESEEIYVGVEAPKNPNFIFLHGFYRTRDVKDPMNWLNKKLPNQDNFWQVLPNPDKPNREEQAEYVLKHAKINENSIIVTHSLGSALALKIIQDKNLKIKKLVMLAPSLGTPTEELKEYKNFKIDFKKIKNNVKEIIIFQASKDRPGKEEEIAEMAAMLDVKIIKVKNSASHFNSDECREVLDEFKKDFWIQDEDTLDTWFSSGTWTFSTLGWPDNYVKGKKIGDLARFHPTQVLETGYEIITLWVSRMIIMSFYALNEIPFEKVYLHGMILDKAGKKMSKSKGNGIDPMEMIEKFGTDAVRLSLLMGNTPGNDAKYSEDKIASFRNFTNKLWNVARFIISNQESGARSQEVNAEKLTLADKWILEKLNDLIKKVTEDLENYQFSQAGERLREFTWNDLADWYLEISKFKKNEEKSQILNYILENLLKLWHPFMPFVTETIWQELGQKKLLMVEKWPKTSLPPFERGAQGVKPLVRGEKNDFELVKEIIIAIRNARAENKVEPARKVKAVIYAGKNKKLIEAQAELIKGLRTGISELEIAEDKSPLPPPVKGGNAGAIYATVGDMEIYLLGAVDSEKEKVRLEKEIINLEKVIKAVEVRLANKEFVSNAPAEIVKKEKDKLKAWQGELKKFREQLKNLW